MKNQRRHARLRYLDYGGPCARALVCGLLLIFAATPAADAAFFPGDPPVPVFSDDFSNDVDMAPVDGWSPYVWTGNPGDYTLFKWWGEDDNRPACAGNWGSVWLRTRYARDYNQSVFIIDQSNPANPADWTNFRLEFDVNPLGDNANSFGAIIGGADTNSDRKIDDGYLFYIDTIPAASDAINFSQRATWHLVKRTNGSDADLGSGPVELDPANTDLLTIYEGTCYRMRVDFFCGNLRVQVKRLECSGVSSCTETTCGGDWCTIIEYTDVSGATLTPGLTGLFHGSEVNVAFDEFLYFDNVEVSTWGANCGAVCEDWVGWLPENREPLEFKMLYDAAILDYSAGPPLADFKIDVNTSEPTSASGVNTTGDNYCNGWNLLVNLPVPNEPTDLDSIRSYLQRSSTAVQMVNDGSGNFSWQDSFDNEFFEADGVTPNPLYNPVPMVADGATPINHALLDAFDWYVAQRSIGGDWVVDDSAQCRKWYVVLISDGDESCPDGNADYACDPGQAASKFANPGIDGIDAVEVHTIGFSESVTAAEALKCVARDTNGTFYSATNASDLSDALYEVFYSLQGNLRSFIPFKVAPPPSSAGGPALVQDFLAVAPFFQARQDQTIWEGNLYAFRLNVNNPGLPANDECEIDLSQILWNANSMLEDQLDDHTVANAERYVYMGSDATGSWARHDLATIPTNAPLRTEFKGLLLRPAVPTDVQAQEVVNFVRYIWMDDDTGVTPDPRPWNRDEAGFVGDGVEDTFALGDMYHSQPVIVNPPNTSMFFFDYGFGDPAVPGAHDYPAFMTQQSKRRRIALVGANDGMLHAFDAGFWDRDRAGSGETYDEAHDLGAGTELFAWVPQAVMPRLWSMTYGLEQQYMVDGPTATGDVYIDLTPTDGTDDPEWRTIAISTMRRGGRGMAALDITQPDPTGSSPDYEPTVSDFPGCRDGSTSGCSGEYPRVMWEFGDQADADTNCPGGLSGVQCAPYWDLGWTWSKPAIARIAVYNSLAPSQPDSQFVAFFGGGWDQTESDSTGNFFYGVDIETGNVVYKYNTSVSMPGSPTALDSDIDGFHDRIYFGDSDGSVWRLEFPAPNDSTHTGADAGTLTRIFDFRLDFPDRQRFYYRPVMVPALFGGSGYTWAIAMGTGDRPNLGRKDTGFDHFYFLLDDGQSTAKGATDLVAINYDDLEGFGDADGPCTSSALNPADGSYGWYFSLRENEKVMFDATVVNGPHLRPDGRRGGPQRSESVRHQWQWWRR